MDKMTSDSDKALEWAQSEYSADSDYWKDRAAHGNGLIKKIANFVIEQAGKAGRE